MVQRYRFRLEDVIFHDFDPWVVPKPFHHMCPMTFQKCLEEFWGPGNPRGTRPFQILIPRCPGLNVRKVYNLMDGCLIGFVHYVHHFYVQLNILNYVQGDSIFGSASVPDGRQTEFGLSVGFGGGRSANVVRYVGRLRR